MLRVIEELRPSWFVGENVAGIIDMELDNVLSGLERTGYSCRAFCVPACGVNAPHRRDRVFIIANNERDRIQMGTDEAVRVRRKIPQIDEDMPRITDIAHINKERCAAQGYQGQGVTGTKHAMKIGNALQLLHTPTTPRPHDNAKTAGKYMPSQNQKDLSGDLYGLNPGLMLQPDFAEWMMGFPIGWSALNASETQ
jgi:site-specific DNA-cytosine methylase